jgi:hypothetical protein
MDGGKYAEYAGKGGYVAIGWNELDDLSRPPYYYS